MSSKTWNIGVVGYGFSAKTFHIPFVQEVPELKLYAIVQRTPKPDDDAEKDHPGIKSYRTSEEMVKDAGVDVVIVTTAPDSHFELVKLALENGKHGEYSIDLNCWGRVMLMRIVVCEKPFTPTSKEAEELNAIAEKNEKLLAVYQSTLIQ